MGQSAPPRIRGPQRPDGVLHLSIFPTNIGWFGLIGHGTHLLSVMAGHVSAAEVRRAARSRFPRAPTAADIAETDWYPQLRRRLETYALGTPDEFRDVDLELPATTEFQRKVLNTTRRIGYGKTLTYGQLAEKAGFPRAARGVGTVMSSNQFPIIIPCHRVVAAGGKIGGYSAPLGVDLKSRLLSMEAGQ
ncbi:MAG: methylated-DNA--[protein]-cysteine S-methyltransferase [Planctomycetes bacterium]|nr:methylated-DNA--[protein]-cysteine S-methyltransferase [Planctomycetota bacterium]